MFKKPRVLVVGLLLAGCNSAPNAVGTTFDDAAVTDLGTPADRPVATDVRVVTDTPVVNDNGTPDAGTRDVGTPDAGTPDVGTPDVGTSDVGTPDAGTPDVGTLDGGTRDAGTPDSGPRDVGTPDTGCVATAETCNGRDDDCNGVIDEAGCGTHLLITEVITGPADAEYVEVFNPTASPIDLANVYVSDSRDYACYLGRACTITGRATDSIGGADFIGRFPAGATLAPGAYAIVAVTRDVAAFFALTGVCPTYHLPNNGSDAGVGSCSASLPLRLTAHVGTTIGGSVGLTNAGETVTVFQWDGSAPLVTDLDYVFWGTAAADGQVDKSSTAVALPADAGTAMYLPDTAAALQQRVLVSSSGNAAVRRCDYSEGAQVRTGGNGLGGNDETSERFTATWRGTAGAPTNDGGVGVLSGTPGGLNNCR